MYDSFCETEIKFCDLDFIKKYLNEENQNTIIVMSKNSADRFLLSDIIKNKNFLWVNSFSNNPTQIDILNSLNIIKNNIKLYNKIIAIGGGSAIDLAKSIAAFFNITNENLTIEYITKKIKSKVYINEKIDIIAIPTTAGTGSEVTQWATIWNYYENDNNNKFSIEHKSLKPKKAFICTELSLTMPKKLILSSALDALCHSIEAFWSKNTNKLSKELSIRSIELIVYNLPEALKDISKYEYRDNLMIASLIAGISFSKTKTTACHSISYPLTSKFKIEHGFAVALTLYEILELNKNYIGDMYKIYNIFDKYNGVKEWLNLVCKDLIELKLSYFGVKKQDIENIVNNSFTKERMDNNPAYISKEDLYKVLNKIF